MKGLLFLGFFAAVSARAAVGQYAGDKVLRLIPENEQHLQFIRNVSRRVKIDFWQPHSVELVTTNRSVDFRVGADWVSDVQTGLEETGLKYDILIENVQTLMEKQFDRKETGSTGYDYEKYHQWDEIESWTAHITDENPNLISRFEIGRSYEGRAIHLLRVGKRTGVMKPAIFMDCGIHAREWISPAFCQWFVKEAVRNYGCNSTMTILLNKMDFLVVPVINVDGYFYSWTKVSVRTSMDDPEIDFGGRHAPGILALTVRALIPNRNFDAKWCSIGASRNPCDDTYCGSHVESEKEVKAIADVIRKYRAIKAYISIHSYSQMCLFPYSYTYTLTSNYKELNTMARNAVKALSSFHGTQYLYGPAAITIYPSAGGSDDWAYDQGIKYSFTFELRDTGRYGFLLPESQIRPTCEETMLAINYIATYVLNHPY